MENGRCLDKMHTWRDRLAVKRQSLRQQQRAVSKRMVTDLEMNGVYRGAGERFNLSSNLRRDDALFPECTRTFRTVHVDTQAFFNRLRVALENSLELRYEVYVPTAKSAQIRNRHAKPQQMNIYGYKPLANVPFALLSPFELSMYVSSLPKRYFI